MPLPLSSSKKSAKPITLAASKGMHGPGSRNESMEEVDSSPSCSAYSPSPTLIFDLPALLERLHADPGYMALLSGKELELLAEMDVTDGVVPSDGKEGFEPNKYDAAFLHQIQEAADRHLTEKNEIRDALGLLKIYHKAHTASTAATGVVTSSGSIPSASSSKSMNNPSNSNNGENQAGSDAKNRKSTSTSKSDSIKLSKVKLHPAASPNKRRRDCEEN